MSRIRFILISPPFLIPAGLLLGGLLIRASADYGGFVDQVYSLWNPEAAPSVVIALTAGLGMVAIGTLLLSLGGFLGQFFGPSPAQVSPSQPVQPSADEASAEWVRDRLVHWRKMLDCHGELGLLGEIESRFNERGAPFITPPILAAQQDLWLVSWLVKKAIEFSRAAATDPALGTPEHSAKIHGFVSEAFRVAGVREGWSSISSVPGARSFVAPIFKGQAAIYRKQCSDSRAFLDFALWLADT